MVPPPLCPAACPTDDSSFGARSAGSGRRGLARNLRVSTGCRDPPAGITGGAGPGMDNREGTTVERSRQFEKSPEMEVRNAIEAFEQILEAMPGDRTALETLFDAYDHLGDHEKALARLVQLADIVVEEGDTDSVPWIYEALVRAGTAHPEVKRTMGELESLMLNMGLPSPSEMAAAHHASRQGVDVSAELTLAWTLRQADELTQEEYSTIVQDLSENSTRHLDSPVSLQHVLYDRNLRCADSVLAYLSVDSGCPVVHLAMFEFDRGKFHALPAPYPSRRGAMVFERLGSDYLVALLNPYDQKLRQEVSGLLNHRCHFYLTGAQDYETFLMRSRQAPAA